MSNFSDMDNVFIMDHPLIQHKISILRNKETGTNEFRKLIEEIAVLMGFEALRDLPLEDVEVETPIETCRTPMISGKKLAVVPVLRAGLGMVNGITTLVPSVQDWSYWSLPCTRLLMSLMSTIVSFRILSTSVSSLWLTPCLQLAALLFPLLTSSNSMAERALNACSLSPLRKV